MWLIMALKCAMSFMWGSNLLICLGFFDTPFYNEGPKGKNSIQCVYYVVITQYSPSCVHVHDCVLITLIFAVTVT